MTPTISQAAREAAAAEMGEGHYPENPGVHVQRAIDAAVAEATGPLVSLLETAAKLLREASDRVNAKLKDASPEEQFYGEDPHFYFEGVVPIENAIASHRRTHGGAEKCPKCGSIEVERCHHAATFALPECDYWTCENCDYKWGHS